jgi:hypothetical protein
VAWTTPKTWIIQEEEWIREHLPQPADVVPIRPGGLIVKALRWLGWLPRGRA